MTVIFGQWPLIGYVKKTQIFNHSKNFQSLHQLEGEKMTIKKIHGLTPINDEK